MDAAEVLAQVSEQYLTAFEAGRLAERAVIDPVVQAYDAVKDDPAARIPTRLALAIYNARRPDQKLSMYVDGAIRKDVAELHTGRAEHDTDVVGRALRAGL